MTRRHLLSWKSLFYDALLPALGRLGPARGDAVLGGLGRLGAVGWPPHAWRLADSLGRARRALRADWDPRTARRALAANLPRFLARDYSLNGSSDAQALARFDVRGYGHLQAALAEGRGAILLGAHLGAYLAGLHWLYRREVPLRLLVQRPRHVSDRMQEWFDRSTGPHPQSSLFLRRGLPPSAAAERILRARAALRDGLAIYLAGDIPWTGPNARPGRLLGRERTFLAFWADLAVLTRAPVLPLFCTHLPGGRFSLTIDPPWTISLGTEGAAVSRFLSRLEAEISAHPGDAIAHLTWPCYNPPTSLPLTATPAPHLSPTTTPTPLPLATSRRS